MPPGERRGGGGGKEAGREEGGRREERRPGEEGWRGSGEGKRAAWEGKGRKSGRARGPGGRGGSGRGGSGGRGGPRRALFSSRSPLPSLPASPSLASRSGLGAPDAASQLPGWLCKTFRKLHRVAGRGRAADPGGQTRATGAPCVPPLSASVSSGRYLHAEQDPPLLRPGWEGAEPRAQPPGQRWGRGRQGPRAWCGAPTFASLVLAFV